MDEEILLQVLNNAEEAIIVLDTNFNINFLNEKSKKLFEKINIKDNFYKMENPFSFDKNFIEENKTNLILGKSIPIKKLNFNDMKLDIEGSLKTLKCSDDIKALILSIQKLNNFDEAKTENAKRRTFKTIRNLILDSILEKRKTINQIAKDVGVNWRTVESHLTYLSGKKYVKEVFCSEFVRIFDITEEGKIKLKLEKHKLRVQNNTCFSNDEEVLNTVTGINNSKLSLSILNNNIYNNSIEINKVLENHDKTNETELDYELSREVEK